MDKFNCAIVTSQKPDKKELQMPRRGENLTLIIPVGDTGELLDTVTAIHGVKQYPSPLVMLKMCETKKQPEAGTGEHLRMLKNVKTSLGFSAMMF